MMRVALLLVTAILLAACGPETTAPPPPPFALTSEATGHYCGMNLVEHKGPKGQIILADQPIWFSSARDAVAFTMLPEEPKNISAIYVSDMARAPSWEEPGPANWIDARQAYYVIGSSMRGGMGAPETVPFSTEAAAAAFAGDNGGQVVSFADIPRDYVLGTDEAGANGDPTPETTGATD